MGESLVENADTSDSVTGTDAFGRHAAGLRAGG